MKTKFILSIVVIVIIFLIVYKLAVNKKKLDENEVPLQTTDIRIPVKTIPVKEAMQEVKILKTGNVAPFKETKVLAASGGTLQNVRFNLGDHVQEGQVLAITDSRTMQLDLQKAQTNATKLQNDLNTYTELLAGKATTQEKVNEIRQNYLDAKNQVNQSRKNVEDALIKAPTSGIVSVKAVEQGIFVSPGTEIATIVNLSRAKVQVNLTEAEVYQVSLGQKVKITTDVYPGLTFAGAVTFISPQADETHNYFVEILVENTSRSILRSGTFVYADFSRKTRQLLLLIPREALTEGIKHASVYVVESGVVHQRSIQAGEEAGGLIRVISGLKSGEQVVTSGQINLREGSPVSISK